MKGFIERALNIRLNGDAPHDIQVIDRRFYRDIVLKGGMGLGESYVRGYWEVEDLYAFQVRLITTLMGKRLSGSIWPQDIIALAMQKLSSVTPGKARKNISFHYNISNSFYEIMLGKSMQYTSAYFTEEGMDLDTAQQRKFEVVAEKLKPFPGCQVLEIGCGWGRLARYLAEEYGCDVTAITLSSEQYRYCREQSMPRKNGTVKFVLTDFRKTEKYIDPGQEEGFDRIVGIGTIAHFVPMFKELVGIIATHLKDGGLAMIDDVCRDVTCNPLVPSQSTWISKYIFPGTHFFSPDQITKLFKNKLIIEQWNSDRSYYRDTCLAWLDNIENNRHLLEQEGQYDDRFYRIWKYYLSGAAAGFEGGFLGQWQIVLSKMSSPYRHPMRLQT